MKNIIAIVTEITTSHIRRTLSGMQRCCKEYGCNLFIFMCERRFQSDNKHDIGEYMIYRVPDFTEFDGAVILNSTIFSKEALDDVVARITAAKTPTSSVELERPGMYSLCIDNKTAMREVVEHMINVHGYRRINFVGGLNVTSEARERLNAYLEVLEESGIPYEPERVFIGDYLKLSGEEAAEHFLKSDLPFPQAIVCANDVMAFGVYNALSRHGIRVPQDVALSGFDDDYEAAYHIPGISSVERMQGEQGYLACQALISGAAEKESGKCLAIAAKPIFRESCGCKSPGAISDAAFRKLHFSMRDMDEKFILETRAMAIALTTVDSFAQLKTVIKQFLPNIECKSFDLYIYNKVLEEGSLDIYKTDQAEMGPLDIDGSESCTLLLSFHDGIFSDDLHEDIHSFVRRASKAEENADYVVSPIHFTDQFFGYCITSGSDFPFESELFFSWIMNIGNAIENIRKRRLMAKMISKLEQSWCYDGLTEVYNRRGFQKYGGRVWRESIVKHKNVLLVFIDLDGLKNINDTYGHDTGDHCIKALACILKSMHRHGEAIMRYGGDEFVIIASDVTEEYANEYVSRLQSAMDQYNTKNILPYRLSASVGTNIILPGKDDSMDVAIDTADRHMYEIKKQKRAKE